jgi:hypothetical protein
MLTHSIPCHFAVDKPVVWVTEANVVATTTIDGDPVAPVLGVGILVAGVPERQDPVLGSPQTGPSRCARRRWMAPCAQVRSDGLLQWMEGKRRGEK